MRFSEMPYSRPDLDGFKSLCERTAQVLRTSEDKDESVKAFLSCQDALVHINTMFSLGECRHTLDTADAFYSAENDFIDEQGPEVSGAFDDVRKALLASPVRKELSAFFGDLFFTNLEIEDRSFKPELIPLMQEENKLMSTYQELTSNAEVEWEGKMIPLTMLGKYKQNPDRAVRIKAFTLEGEYYDSHAAELDEIYDKLVHIRDRQARMLGHKNYLQLGYDRLGRNCYGPKEVAEFRKMILEDVVPVVTGVKHAQRDRIGVDTLYLYDDPFWFPDGNADPQGSAEDILNAGRDLYHKMSPETSEFIDFMYDNDLLDVLSRKGKAPGGYCTQFDEFSSPFIFANFNGTAADVDVLTHEGGHAFAAYRAFKNGLPNYYMNPTIEACEVHSMSMEFLTAPGHGKFFGDKTKKYAYYHAADSLCFLPYGCLVDAFQHKVYENPDLTPAQRHELWDSLEKQFRPYLCRDGMPFYGRGAGWQRQLHIYLDPLYYIDYCMAQTVAFDFFTASLEDYEDAWKRYLSFVDKGGTKTFAELVRGAGFPCPYEKGAIRDVALKIGKWLDENAI